MKKSLFIAFLLALVVFSTTPRVEAQTLDTPATTAQVAALRDTLITLLTQIIAQLQAQIATLIAEQANQTMQLGAVQTQVDAVVEQTKPMVITPIAPQAPSVS